MTDSDNKRIQILDSEGAYKGSIPIEGWRKGTFNLPYIDTDGKGNIYVTDPLNNRALKLDPEGNLIGVLKPQKDGKDILKTPAGIALDKRRGIVYIVDTWNHRIRKYGLDEFRPL